MRFFVRVLVLHTNTPEMKQALVFLIALHSRMHSRLGEYREANQMYIGFSDDIRNYITGNMIKKKINL